MAKEPSGREDALTSDSLDLLRAFNAIESAEQRRALISLARTFSGLGSKFPDVLGPTAGRDRRRGSVEREAEGR